MTAPSATEVPLPDPPARAPAAAVVQRRLGERDARRRQLDLVRRLMRARSAARRPA